jgi:hypothetical protein
MVVLFYNNHSNDTATGRDKKERVKSKCEEESITVLPMTLQ